MIDIKRTNNNEINFKININNEVKDVNLKINENGCCLDKESAYFNDEIGKKLYISVKNYAFLNKLGDFYLNNTKINLDKNYKTLMFDLDETIFDFKTSEKKAIIKTMKDFNIKISDEDTLYFSKINDDLFNMFSQGIIKKRITFQEKRIEEFATYLNKNVDKCEGNKKYIKYLEESSDIFKDSVRVLQTLKNKYRIVAVTNGMHSVQIERLKNAGLYDYFSAIYVSSKIGYHKPDINFFKEVFKKEQNNNLDDYLIIGDSQTSDMQGGINASIDTCFLNRNNKKSSMIYTYEIKNLEELLKVL